MYPQGFNGIMIGEAGLGKSFSANALEANACQSGYRRRIILHDKYIKHCIEGENSLISYNIENTLKFNF